jgi:Na+/H+-dicarboxylate symporter
MGLSGRIFIGLILGVGAGIFFGELVADLKLFGDIFVKLLQMTVLPYIMVSLIAGFGRLELGQARRLALRGSLALGLIWILALALVFTSALAFPLLDTASFFSHTTAPDLQQHDLVDLYVPANVFYSLANDMVPAVVLFSILVGVALISVQDRSDVLRIFDGLGAALARINGAIVQLTPLGIFAIAAAAAGTMTIDELGRVQVYLATYIGLALLVTFWVFPALVATLSGIPYREVLATFRDALVTAFATGNQFVVLPQIAENCKSLLRRHGLGDADSDSAVDIIVPVSFNFPSLGKLLVILFVLFAAWFTDTPLGPTDQLGLAVNGLFALFGSINVAVPYMLDFLRVPADMFQLFLVTGIVVGRFGAMLAALHIIVLSIIGTLALRGDIRLGLRPLLVYLGSSAMLMAALVLGLRGYFAAFVPDMPPREQVLSQVSLMQERVDARVFTEAPEPEEIPPSGSRLNHIIASGVLQVGYRPSNLPCTFLTPDGRLVGFDIELMHMLAEDLGVALKFVPFDFGTLRTSLDAGQIDLALSCIAGLPDRYALASFSRPYLDLTLGLVVPDHERADFYDLDALRRREDLAIALVGSHYFEPRLRRLLPGARIVILESAEAFFAAGGAVADALVLSVEEGTAYAYRHPQFSVVQTRQGGHVPAVIAVPKGDIETEEFISGWLDLKRMEGTLDQLYQYWMLGGAARPREPRWSIIRDVLHWVD